MAYMGAGKLADIAPNHPFARPQISFGIKPPSASTPTSEDKKASEDIPDDIWHRQIIEADS